MEVNQKGTPKSPAREQVYHRPGHQRHVGALVRQVPPAKEPAESATGASVGKVPPAEGAR